MQLSYMGNISTCSESNSCIPIGILVFAWFGSFTLLILLCIMMIEAFTHHAWTKPTRNLRSSVMPDVRPDDHVEVALTDLRESELQI